jgi:hypothetical protein
MAIVAAIRALARWKFPPKSTTKLQRMLGHLPGPIHPTRSVLVVGFGGGITAGTFTTIQACSNDRSWATDPATSRAISPKNYGG